jgi:hypothetical protein
MCGSTSRAYPWSSGYPLGRDDVDVRIVAGENGGRKKLETAHGVFSACAVAQISCDEAGIKLEGGGAEEDNALREKPRIGEDFENAAERDIGGMPAQAPIACLISRASAVARTSAAIGMFPSTVHAAPRIGMGQSRRNMRAA